MARRSATLTLVTLMLTALGASLAAAAEDVLKVVPVDALGVGMIHRLDATEAKIMKLAQTFGAPGGFGPVAELKRTYGVDKGLDEKGTVAAILMAGEDAEAAPVAVVALPTSDYKALLAGWKASAEEKIAEVTLGGRKKGYLVAQRDGYALLVEESHRATLEKVLSSKQSLVGEMAPMQPWLGGNDMAAVITRAGIKTLVAKARKELKQGREHLGQTPEMAILASMMDVYDKALETMDGEVALAAGGFVIEADNAVRATGRARFLPDSRLGKSLGEVKPLDADLMAQIPGGSFVVAFAGGAPEQVMKELMGLSVELMKKGNNLYGLTPEQAEKLGQISARTFADIQGMAFVMKTGRQGEPLYSNMYGAMRVSNSAELLDKYQKQIEASNEILKQAKDSLMKPSTATKTEIGGRPALEIQMTMPLPKMGEENEANRAVMDMMFGPGGKVTMYLVATEPRTVLVGYGTTKERMLAVIESSKGPKKGFAADEDVAATDALLPRGTLAVGYVSPRGYMELIRRMMNAALQGRDLGEGFQIPPFPKSPPVGMALKASAGEIEATLVVPSGLWKAAQEYRDKMMQRFQAPEAP